MKCLKSNFCCPMKTVRNATEFKTLFYTYHEQYFNIFATLVDRLVITNIVVSISLLMNDSAFDVI